MLILKTYELLRLLQFCLKSHPFKSTNKFITKIFLGRKFWDNSYRYFIFKHPYFSTQIKLVDLN